MNHTTFLVNLIALEQQAVTPVLEDEQARVDSAQASAGHVVDVVNCLVHTSVGVKVTAKLHAERASVVNHAIAGIVHCAVKGHVLQEVSETTLALLFLQ